MNKKYILWSVLVGYTTGILSLDQELLECHKQQALTILDRHEYKAYLYSAAFAGLVYGSFCTWQYFKPGYGQTRPETKTWEEWVVRQGEDSLSLVYSAGKAQIASYLGALVGGAIGAMPVSLAIKNDVVSSFARANLPWYIAYHTQFHTHTQQALERAKYWISTLQSGQHIERDAVLQLLQQDIQNIEQDCYALLGALQAFQERDYLEINQTMYTLHYTKIEKTIQECFRQLMLPDEQVIVLAQQKKDVASVLQDFALYVQLIFV